MGGTGYGPISLPVPLDAPTETKPAFSQRLRATVEEAILLGVKGMIIVILTLWAVGWVLRDYAAVREQAQYVAQIRAAQAQQARPPSPPPPAPRPQP